MSRRKNKRLPWQQGVRVDPGRGGVHGLWWLLVFIGFGTALVCSVPLYGRFVLLSHADGFVRTTLTVESVRSSGRKGADRYQAEGPLGTGGSGRVRLTQYTPRALPTLEAVEAHFAARPVVLDVMVNDALEDDWVGAFRVRRHDPDLRGTETRHALILGAFIAGGLVLGLFALARPLRRR